MKTLAAVLLLLCVADTVAAQERVIARANLPRQAAQRILDFYHDSATARHHGATRIGAGETIAGNVAVLDGGLTVAGRVAGSVLVLNGDLALEDGGAVTGDVTIVGGALLSGADAAIGGTLTIYSEGMRIAADDDDARDARETRARRTRGRTHDGEEDDEWRNASHDMYLGGARVAVRLGESYNRVEGLPVQIGPQIETNGRNPLRIQALAVLRTEDGSTPQIERVGYDIRVEQFLGGRRDLRVGATGFSVVSPIERWQHSDLEASLATFLFQSDPRDHYERTGAGAYLRYTPDDLPLVLSAEYRHEEYASVGAGNPWSLFGDGWRRQPLVAEGELQSVLARATVDRRDDDEEPTSGWFAEVRARHGLSGSLTLPAMVDARANPVFAGPRSIDAGFTTAVLDVRAYQRVGLEGVLALRAIGGGALSDRELPPQFQHAFGGSGGLGGFALADADCGARSAPVTTRFGTKDAVFFPFYGCDNFGMVQAEYRGGFSFDFGIDMPHHSHVSVHDHDAGWALFVEAGRGWAFGERAGAANTGTLADVGAGIFLGDLGAYIAVPVTGDDHDARVFLRLGRRF